MTIEFRCNSCQRLLRVPDDSAGREARCPACEAVQPVPAISASGGSPPPPPGGFEGAELDESPYRSPQASPAVETSAPGELASGQIDLGDILTTTWNIASAHYFPLLGGYLLMMVVGLLVMFVLVGLPAVGIVVLAGINQPADPSPAAIAVIVALAIVIGVIAMFATFWVQAGFLRFQLRIAREEVAEFGELFTGTPYTLSLVLASVMFMFVIYLGLILCIVPGVFIGLIWSQYVLLIVDRNAGPVESLRQSAEITVGNRLNLLLVWLVVMAIAMGAGFVPLIGSCISFLIQPFIAMVFVVTYLRLTGQPIAIPVSKRQTAVGEG